MIRLLLLSVEARLIEWAEPLCGDTLIDRVHTQWQADDPTIDVLKARQKVSTR